MPKCFSSLQKSKLPVEVIVVDNNSTDDTVALIQKNYPEVRVIQTGKNLGFGKGNNIGLTIALEEHADYVFLLNQDAWIEPDTIDYLVRVAKEYPSFGIISPLHLSSDGQSLEYKFIEYIQPSECTGLVSDKFLNRLQTIYETTFVNAAAWLICKTCLKEVGLFDPLFPHYGEDVDYVQRTQYHGFKVGIVPAVCIYHDSKIQTWGEIALNKKRMLTIYLSEVKNINGSLRSNLLVFFKRRFDELSAHLLYRQIKLLLLRFQLTIKILWMIPTIKHSRKESQQKSAFLEQS